MSAIVPPRAAMSRRWWSCSTASGSPGSYNPLAASSSGVGSGPLIGSKLRVDDLDLASHAIGEVARQVARHHDGAALVEVVARLGRGARRDGDLARLRGVVRLGAPLVPSMDGGVADDELVVDGVRVADDEPHGRALDHLQPGGPEAAVVELQLDRHRPPPEGALGGVVVAPHEDEPQRGHHQDEHRRPHGAAAARRRPRTATAPTAVATPSTSTAGSHGTSLPGTGTVTPSP